MSYLKTEQNLRSLLKELASFPKETEWVEFKHNGIRPEDLGEYISALANSAALLGKTHGYLVWGVRDEDHAVVGTNFMKNFRMTPRQLCFPTVHLKRWILKKKFRQHTFIVFSVI